MKHILLSAALLAALLLPGTLRAQTTEARSERWAKIVDNLPKISGYGELGYEWTDDSSTFEVKTVRLSLSGDLGSKFDYKFQFEFADKKSYFSLVDAYVRYKLMPELSFSAGQMHTNFALEGPFAALDLEAINAAPITSVVCSMPNPRDIGVAAYGSFGHRDGFNLVEYQVGVYNGAGRNRVDDNKSKDVVMRVKVNPLEELTVSASYSYGELGAAYEKINRYAVGAWWHSDTFWARTEYMGMSGKGGDVNGCYLVAGYWIDKVSPLARFSYMDNKRGGHMQQADFLVGVDYKPIKNVRLQANYTRSQYKGGGHNNILGLAVTGIF